MNNIWRLPARRARYNAQFSILKLCLVNCALCILFTACVPSTRPTIKISLVAPFEGRYREIGEEIIYAVRLAVREANEAGGVGGYSIELMAYDDGGNPAQAEEQARKLATDPQVIGVVGNWLEATTAAAAPALADSGIPYLATSSSPDLHPSAFRLWLTDSAYTNALPRAAACPLPCDTLEDLSWLDRHGGSDFPVAGPYLWGLNQFPRLAHESATEVVIITPSPLPMGSTDPSFADRYRAVSLGVEPRFLAVLAYDATRLLFAAIERNAEVNGLPTRSGVGMALAQSDYAGLSGHFSFDSNLDWVEGKGWVYQWREGKLTKP
jgi:ABC-type branched-subunit amino acid transport system substrate-binding protein